MILVSKSNQSAFLCSVWGKNCNLAKICWHFSLESVPRWSSGYCGVNCRWSLTDVTRISLFVHYNCFFFNLHSKFLPFCSCIVRNSLMWRGLWGEMKGGFKYSSIFFHSCVLQWGQAPLSYSTAIAAPHINSFAGTLEISSYSRVNTVFIFGKKKTKLPDYSAEGDCTKT